MKKLLLRSLFGVLLISLLWGGFAVGAQAATEPAQVLFQASEPDADGYFTLTLSVAQARFNAFQFVLRYDTVTLRPTDATGQPASFLDEMSENQVEWLSVIGSQLDAQQGLIDLTCYVKPGLNYHTADRAEAINCANIGGATVLYKFYFQRIGNQPVVLELAVQDGDKPYRDYLADGAVLSYAGFHAPADFTVSLPASLGQSLSLNDNGTLPENLAEEIASDQPTVIEQPRSELGRDERLQDLVMLQIDNYAAALEGRLVHIYPGETQVAPYIRDSRTFVPLRFVAESLGCEVNWDAARKTAVVVSGATTVEMPVGSRYYTVNGVTYSMDTAAELTLNRTFVPIRFVAQTLGKSVTWDGANSLVFVAPADRPWDLNGGLEQELTSQLLLLTSPLLRDLV